MSHIFISYSKKDIAFARHLRGLLEAEGFAVWMDETRLMPADDWWDQIEANIESCAAFIVIMSHHSRNSRWVKREILYAENNKKPICPILYREESWPRLANLQYVDMRQGDNPPLPDRLCEWLREVLPAQQAELVTDETQDTSHVYAPSPEIPVAEYSQPSAREQRRKLETATPACTKLNHESKLKIKISLPESPGLRAELPEVLPSGDVIQQGDVRSIDVPLTFPVSEHTGQLESGSVCIKINTDQFDVVAIGAETGSGPSDHHYLTVPPTDDSQTLNFRLIPKAGQQPGPASIYVLLYQDNRQITTTDVVIQLVNDMNEHDMCGNWRLQVAMMRWLRGPATRAGPKLTPSSDATAWKRFFRTRRTFVAIGFVLWVLLIAVIVFFFLCPPNDDCIAGRVIVQGEGTIRIQRPSEPWQSVKLSSSTIQTGDILDSLSSEVYIDFEDRARALVSSNSVVQVRQCCTTDEPLILDMITGKAIFQIDEWPSGVKVCPRPKTVLSPDPQCVQIYGSSIFIGINDQTDTLDVKCFIGNCQMVNDQGGSNVQIPEGQMWQGPLRSFDIATMSQNFEPIPESVYTEYDGFRDLCPECEIFTITPVSVSEIEIYRDKHSLTLYLPENQSLSSSEWIFSANSNDYPLTDFSVDRLLDGELCLRLEYEAATISDRDIGKCSEEGTEQYIVKPVGQSQRFWYNQAQGDVEFEITYKNYSIATCSPSSQPCVIELPTE